MEKIYYDCRTGEWKRNLDITYLAPEMYFEVKESEDDMQHHVFETDNTLVEFATPHNDQEKFKKFYDELAANNNYLRRKEWRLPSSSYKYWCRYFGIK